MPRSALSSDEKEVSDQCAIDKRMISEFAGVCGAVLLPGAEEIK